MKTIKNHYNPVTKIKRYIATVTLNGNTDEYEIQAPNSFEASKDLHGRLNLQGVRRIMTDIKIKELSNLNQN